MRDFVQYKVCENRLISRILSKRRKCRTDDFVLVAITFCILLSLPIVGRSSSTVIAVGKAK